MVAHAIFGLIGIVGVRGAEALAQGGVVVAVLILIADEEGYGRSRATPFKHAREYLHAVGFVARRGQRALAWPPTVEARLHIAFVNGNASRKTVQHAAYAGTVAFAKAGKAQ